jgi:hypothetical protein
MMGRHRIAQRVSRLEQTVGYRIQVLTHAQREAISEETYNFVRASAASRGFFQEGNESLAEMFARSLGISCRELTARLKARASTVPVASQRSSSPRRQR